MSARKPREESVVDLIHHVQLEPLLWQKQHPKYNDNVAKGFAWGRVAQKIGGGADRKELMTQWKRVRAKYMDKKRKLGTGSGAEDSIDYVYAEDMRFLDDELDDRPTRSSSLDGPAPKQPPPLSQADLFEDPSQASGSASTTSEAAPGATFTTPRAKPKLVGRTPPAKRVKYDPVVEQLRDLIAAPEVEDDCDLVGKMVANFMRRIEPRRRSLAKMHLETAMHQFEYGELITYVSSGETSRSDNVGLHLDEDGGPASAASTEQSDARYQHYLRYEGLAEDDLVEDGENPGFSA